MIIKNGKDSTGVFNLGLIQQLTAGAMASFIIGNQMIILSTLEHVIANNDGTLDMHFISGRLIKLQHAEAKELQSLLEAAIQQAIARAQAEEAERKFGLSKGRN
ncbi:MAG: hypothetical protein BWY07_01992 [Candidatus Hydrogenedentes bacterium ADurb.Bin170]|nr:MAG: hypothetical protein BWY07_01992 [Candidatus Hydrogenedentes bacterium ADurb.Bin170]